MLLSGICHWGLPFSDQVRRLQAGEEAIRSELGDKAPQNFVIGIQHSLEKVPLNKYWFKGRFTTRVALSAARNEYDVLMDAHYFNRDPQAILLARERLATAIESLAE